MTKNRLVILGLLLLIALTAIGYFAKQKPFLQDNALIGDAKSTHQLASTAIDVAKDILKSRLEKPHATSVCSSPPCLVFAANLLGNPALNDDSWWQENATPLDKSNSKLNTGFFIIEETQFEAFELSPLMIARGVGLQHYRITARGYGASLADHITLQQNVQVHYH